MIARPRYGRTQVQPHERCTALTQFSGYRDRCANRASEGGMCRHHLKARHLHKSEPGGSDAR